MSNTNNNMQTQTSNTLHNAIMEVGSKDRPPMLEPGNFVQWKSRIKRYIDTKPNHELIHYCLENPPYQLDWTNIKVLVFEGSPITTTERIRDTYKNLSQDIRDQLNAKAEAVQIILTGIDNDIYSTVDACPNACEMWKAIERLKMDGESLESYYSRFYKMMNELIKNQCKVTNHQVNVQFLLQLQPEWQRNRGKATHNTPQPIYDQEPSMVDEDDETSKDKEIDKLMALISLSELEAHYMYVAQLQQVSPDAANSGPIFNDEPLQKNDDDNDLAKERELLASLIEKLKCEIDESKNRNKFLETSNKALIEKLKGEIEDFKNKNKSLESSNNFFKEANNRLSETNYLLYADYKKSEAELARRNSEEYASQMELECAKVREANNRLSETNNLLYADNKKSEEELARRNSKEYVSQMELNCAKVRGDFYHTK
nr:hypothetical protein [Tanacetum cinerariifolium]